jgi:hypothetical protein
VTLRSTFRLAFALGLPNMEVLYVTLRSTFRLGRWPSDSLIGRSYHVTPRNTFRFGCQPSDPP